MKRSDLSMSSLIFSELVNGGTQYERAPLLVVVWSC
jgi:hypothetical protein